MALLGLRITFDQVQSLGWHTAIAAIGAKTSLKSFVDMDLKPLGLVVAETLVLAALVYVAIAWK